MTTRFSEQRRPAAGARSAWSQVLATIGILAGVVWLARALEPASFGELAVTVALANLARFGVLGPIAAGARWAGSMDDGQELRELLLAVRYLALRRALWIAVPALLAGSWLWAAGQTGYALLALGAGAFTIFRGATTVVEVILEARGFSRNVAIHRSILPILQYALAVAVTNMAGSYAGAALIGFAAAAWMLLVSEMLTVQRKITAKLEPYWDVANVLHWVRRIREQAQPHARSGVVEWLQAGTDRWSLALFAGAYQAGIYAMAFDLAFTPIRLLTALVAHRVRMVLSSGDRDLSDTWDARQLRRGAVLGFTLAAGALILAVAMAERLAFHFLLPPDYWPSAGLVPILAAAGGLYGLAQIQSGRVPLPFVPDPPPTPVGLLLAGPVVILIGAAVAGAVGTAAGHALYALTLSIWATGGPRADWRADIMSR